MSEILFTFENQFDKHNRARCDCYKDRIILSTCRDGGLLGYYANKERTIFISDISSVTISEGPGQSWSTKLLFAGIQFLTKAGHELSPDIVIENPHNHRFDLLIDNNAMLFMQKNSKEQIQIARSIREYVHKCLSSQKSYSNAGIVDELLRLKQLLDSRVVTEEEYNSMKKKLLDS